MADVKISALPSSTTPLAGTEVLPIVQSSTTKKVTVADLTAGRTVNADTLNATNVEVTNVKAKDGTAAITIADSTGDVGLSGNLTFSGTGQRITGDMSNATWANRLAVQTSTTNGNTNLTLLPNGTGTASQVVISNSSDTANNSYLGLVQVGTTDSRIQAGIQGTGTYTPMTFYAGGSERMRLDTSGNVGIGNTVASTINTVNGVGNLVVGSGSGSEGITIYTGTADTGAIAFADGTTTTDTYRGYINYAHATDHMAFWTSASEKMRIDSSGKITDQYGNIRAVPRTGSAKTTSYTLATTDVGQFVEVGSGGSITVPDATFATGDVVSIFNNTTGNITLTMSITTAYIGGTDSDKATITLATRGVATILFISGTVCVVNGNVS